MEKLVPQSLDIERAVLGAFMIQKDTYHQYEGDIAAEDFLDPRNGIIMRAIEQLSSKSKKIDMLTVVNEAKSIGYGFDDIHSYIPKLTMNIGSTAHVDTHIKILKQYSIKRNLIRLARQIEGDAYNENSDVFDILDSVDSQMDSINSKFSIDSVKSLPVMYEEMTELWGQREQGVNDSSSIQCGLKGIDDITGGYRSGNMIVVAGRPGMGKSTVALQKMVNCAKSGVNAGFISLEMPWQELFSKVLSGENQINFNRLLRDTPTASERAKLDKWYGEMKSKGLHIIDASSMNVVQMKSAIRKLVKQDGCKIVTIDYLQLISGSSRGNREQEVSSITRAIKSAALAYKIPILALSQLNRSVETRGGAKKPQLSDLRESGSIEQDADIVEFIYRPEYYDISEYEDGESTSDTLEVIIAKHRGGRLDTIRLNTDLKHSIVKDKDRFTFNSQPLEPDTTFQDSQPF